MFLVGLYVHIPFCNNKCPYCDFYSKKFSNEELEKYTNAVCDRMYNLKKQDNISANTLYFGGGTPSVLGTKRILKIINTAKELFLLECSEITIEVNPSSSSLLDYKVLCCAGVNRISVGLQSANDDELKVLGRNHSAIDVYNVVENIKSGGIHNISLDIMLGIPNQTTDSLKKTLRFCQECNVNHISAYLLKLEKNTLFYKMQKQLNLPDEDKQIELFEEMCRELKKNNYDHYEISNFCKENKISKHNVKYWNCDEYIGIGASAHSYFKGKRFYYKRNITSFYNNEIINDGIGGTEEEYIMLRLRLEKGVIFSDYEARFKIEFKRRYFENALKLEKYGLTKVTKESVSITEKGYLLSNSIISSILYN